MMFARDISCTLPALVFDCVLSHTLWLLLHLPVGCVISVDRGLCVPVWCLISCDCSWVWPLLCLHVLSDVIHSFRSGACLSKSYDLAALVFACVICLALCLFVNVFCFWSNSYTLSAVVFACINIISLWRLLCLHVLVFACVLFSFTLKAFTFACVTFHALWMLCLPFVISHTLCFPLCSPVQCLIHSGCSVFRM